MDRSQWFRMMIDDRELIIRFIGGVSVSRDYKVPWRPDEDALGDFWDTYKQEFKEGHQ